MRHYVRPLSDYRKVLKAIIYALFNRPFFGKIGRWALIYSPLKIVGKRNIFIEEDVKIGYKTWLSAVPYTGCENCKLLIGKNVSIGNFNHIISTHSIIIEDNVLTADKVYVSDNIHGYDNITMPIKLQPIVQKNDVIIGEGSWLGENVCVIGASIGKHCVIGANSVVTRDIPDYSIAVGAPARVVKRWDDKEKTWKKISYGNR